MNKVTILSLSLALVAGSVILQVQPAEAAPWGVNRRQANQQSRIYNGVRNNSLTGREAYRLQQQQFALNRKEQRFRASGNGLSASERARLQHQQNQLSQNIYHQKHDGQGWDPNPGWNNHPNWNNGPGPNPGGWGNYRGVNARQETQQNRLSQGVQSGQLTPTEYNRLQNQQSNLAAQEARFRDSGNGLNMHERAILDARQDALSRNINRQVHDGQAIPPQ